MAHSPIYTLLYIRPYMRPYIPGCHTPLYKPPLHSPYIQALEIRLIISPEKSGFDFPENIPHFIFPGRMPTLFFASCMVAYSQKSQQKKLEKSPASYPERKAHAIKIGILSFPSPGPVYFSWIFSGLNSRIYFPASYPHFVFSASHGHAPYTTADSPSHWILPSSESGDLTKACQWWRYTA